MAKDRDQIIRASVYTTVGALWLALTGTCTINFARTGEQFAGMWPVGLWFMSIGVLPLVVGLRTLLPARPLGWGLGAVAAAWLLFGVKWLADSVMDAARHGGNGGDMAFIILLWVVFQAPGASMLWGAVAILRDARPRPPGASAGPG